MSGKEELEFRGTVVRCIYSTFNFKIYAMDVSEKEYPNIKHNKFNNVSVVGDLPELTEGCEYKISAIEENGKYGASYRVSAISRDLPTSASGTKKFLREVLTEKQADTLYEAYPDIIERVKKNNISDIDLSKLPGIGEITMKRIIDKIIDNFALVDVVAEFGGILSLSAIKKIYAKYKSVDRLKEKLYEEPYTTLTEVSGIGFKSADKMVLEIKKSGVIYYGYDVETSENRCLACVLYLLKENEKEGHTRSSLANIRRQCFEIVPECADKFLRAIMHNDVWYSHKSMTIALASTYNKEMSIAKTVVDNVSTDNVWYCDSANYKNAGEFELSDEQLGVIDNVCNNRISILNGAAGCGKTASTKALIRMLDDYKKSYILMAPTGKASKILSEMTERHAHTIHRSLGYNPSKGWAYNRDNKLFADVIIVDESSMIDVDLFYHLLDAIDFGNTRLLLIGDSAQLPSVGCGNVFHDLIESEAVPTTTLKKVFRYGEGGLMKVATDVRLGKKYLDKSMEGKVTTFGNNKDYTYIDVEQEKIPDMAAKLYKKILDTCDNAQDVQVICCKNIGDYGTIALNNSIQKSVNKNYGDKKCMKVGEITYYEDDLVLQCKNNYDAVIWDTDTELDENSEPITATITNGETGRIVEIMDDCALINFDDIIVQYSKRDMDMVKLGYAITAHKSQGSSINNIIVLTPKADTYMLNSNLLYVALTRMKKHCYHLGTMRTVNIAVNKKANLKRNTFMQQMISAFKNQTSIL